LRIKTNIGCALDSNPTSAHIPVYSLFWL
jgi:hypothetical protein